MPAKPFSEALHQELAGRGVRVTALCPGPVPTEFQARAWIHGRGVEGVLTLSAGRVAQIGYAGFMRGKRVVVAGAGNRVLASLLRLIPNRILLPVSDLSVRRLASDS